LGVLAQLGEGTPLFAQYVEQQNAVAAQLNASELLKETGSSREGTPQTAQQQLDRIAREMMSADKTLTYAVAFARATDANPQLYTQHQKGE
jgi:K+-transporting ATPase c subunit